MIAVGGSGGPRRVEEAAFFGSCRPAYRNRRQLPSTPGRACAPAIEEDPDRVIAVPRILYGQRLH